MGSSAADSPDPKVSDLTFADFYRAMAEREHSAGIARRGEVV